MGDLIGATKGESKLTLYCSFCGKSQHEVLVLIAGPTVFICDECTDLCASMTAEHRVRKAVSEVLAEMGITPRDSGSDRNGEDSRSEAECEASQSGLSASEGIAQPLPEESP